MVDTVKIPASSVRGMKLEPGEARAAEGTPLRLDETRVYLAEWLTRRGRAGAGFSEDQIRRIHKVAGGDLARIEQLAAQCFQDPAAPERAGGRASPRYWLAGAAALLILAAGAVLLLPGPEQQQARAPRTETAAAAAGGAAQPELMLGGVREADWLLGEDGDQYVLQLIGAREMRTLQNYVERAAIPPRTLTLMRSRRDGGDWYLLLYGLYPDADTARRQGLKLPRYARELHPWPRRLADLRAEAGTAE
jgi:septal ring-binding cell division protein DamX